MTDVLIRAATLSDVPQMVVNAEAFMKETPFSDIPFEPLSTAAMLTECVEAGLCFVADQDGLHIGGIGAVHSVLPLNNNIEVAVERFWWIVPDDRARGVGVQLLTALRDAAKSIGCDRLIMVALVNDNLPLVEKSYLRFGLQAAERTYMMRL